MHYKPAPVETSLYQSGKRICQAEWIGNTSVTFTKHLHVATRAPRQSRSRKYRSCSEDRLDELANRLRRICAAESVKLSGTPTLYVRLASDAIIAPYRDPQPPTMVDGGWQKNGGKFGARYNTLCSHHHQSGAANANIPAPPAHNPLDTDTETTGQRARDATTRPRHPAIATDAPVTLMAKGPRSGVANGNR